MKGCKKKKSWLLYIVTDHISVDMCLILHPSVLPSVWMCRCYNGEARSGSPHLRGQCSSHYEVYHHTLTYNTNLLNFNHLSSSLLLKLLKKSQGAITSAGFSFFYLELILKQVDDLLQQIYYQGAKYVPGWGNE